MSSAIVKVYGRLPVSKWSTVHHSLWMYCYKIYIWRYCEIIEKFVSFIYEDEFIRGIITNLKQSSFIESIENVFILLFSI